VQAGGVFLLSKSESSKLGKSVGQEEGVYPGGSRLCYIAVRKRAENCGASDRSCWIQLVGGRVKEKNMLRL